MPQATVDGPTLQVFPTSGTQGANSDIKLSVSLNGKLVSVSSNDPAAKEGWNRELYGVNWNEFDNLVGRLLTLADATFTDTTQRKAFKDLIRQHVKEWVQDIMLEAAHDAGFDRHCTVPFVGGVLDQVGGLFGVEGEPTP
jgi:hypothetical protein